MLFLQFRVNGLNVKNMTEEDFEGLVDRTLLELWNSKKSQYASEEEAQFIKDMNKAIGDRTLEEVTQWLKEHTAMEKTKTCPFMRVCSTRLWSLWRASNFFSSSVVSLKLSTSTNWTHFWNYLSFRGWWTTRRSSSNGTKCHCYYQRRNNCNYVWMNKKCCIWNGVWFVPRIAIYREKIAIIVLQAIILYEIEINLHGTGFSVRLL